MMDKNRGQQGEVQSQKELLLKLRSEKEELEEGRQQLRILLGLAVVLGLAGPVCRTLVWVVAEAPVWRGYPEPVCV